MQIDAKSIEILLITFIICNYVVKFFKKTNSEKTNPKKRNTFA